jgi:hypothetical protein
MDDININNLSIPRDDLAVTTNVDDLACMICMNICFKPVLITCCERLMCLACIKMMLKHSTTTKCPHCNNLNINFVKPSRILLRMFENLSFFCVNKSSGCKDKIKYDFYFDHIYNKCEFKKEKQVEYCKNCQEIYKNYTEHNCRISKNLVDFNRSLLEKMLDAIYDINSDSTQEDNKSLEDNLKFITRNNHTQGVIYHPK